MADAAYGAVYLRMHPTGKGVLSLTEESSGQEGKYAQLVVDELGIPPEDIKVVHEDTDRFGNGHGYSSSPSEGTPQGIAATARKLREKGWLIAASMLNTPPQNVQFDNGAWFAGRDHSRGVKFQDVCLQAHAGVELPPGLEGWMDAQTTYKA